MLKRGFKGTYRRMSWPHLNRYVNELTERQTSANSTPSTR